MVAASVEGASRSFRSHAKAMHKSHVQKPSEMAPLNCLALFGAWLHGRHAVRSPGSSQCLGSIDSQSSADHVDRMGNAVTEILSFF